MNNSYAEILELVKKSQRRVNPQWLDDELFAIKSLDKADVFTSKLETGRKYSNPSDSAVAYLIGITDEPPQKNPVGVRTGRVDPPDIDLDFEDKHRESVKQYFQERWDYTANIATYAKFSSRGLVKDLSRVFGIPLAEANRVCKLFNSIDEYEQSEETRWFRDKYPEILTLAKKFEGRRRQGAMHAAGVVVSDIDLAKILPLESRTKKKGAKERLVSTAYDMDDCQALGLIKIDFLGLEKLTVEHNCLDVIESLGKEVPDLDHLDLEDAEILGEFSKGHTVGIFQSEAMSSTNLIKKMGIDSFKDLVVSNALVRPGPLLTVGTSYINRKKGLEEVESIHPIISDITKDTFNLFIFQEQLLEALVRVGGFSWPEADKVRKIIGKKRDMKEFAIYEQKWMDNASKLMGKGRAKKQWTDFEKFAGYAFNRSHATVYSIVSFENMWLKKKFPLEFMYGLLSAETDKDKVSLYLVEAKRLGIKLILPDINKSDKHFAVEGENGIRFGLSDIKGVGEAAAEEILSKRPFDSYDDFIEKIDKRRCNKSVVEVLDKTGAFLSLQRHPNYDPDEYIYDLLNYPVDFKPTFDFGIEFTPLVDVVAKKECMIRAMVKTVDKHPQFCRITLQDSSGMGAFYHNSSDVEDNKIIIAIAINNSIAGFTYEEDFIERLNNGYELTPFERYIHGETLEQFKKLRSYDVGYIDDQKSLVVPIHIRYFTTRKGDKMCSVVFSDGGKTCRAVLFPKVFKRFAGKVQPYVPLVVKMNAQAEGEDYIVQDNGIILAEQLLKMKEIKEEYG